MATLKAIRKQISGVKSTKKVTSAMKMISSVKLRRAIARMNAGANYKTEVTRVLCEILKNNVSDSHPFIEPPINPSQPLDILMVSSDKGLCGAFNENLFKIFEKYIVRRKEAGGSYKIYSFGRKSRDFLNRKKLEAEGSFFNVPEGEIFSTLQGLCQTFKERFLSGKSSGAVVIHNVTKGAGNYETVVQQLLPLDQSKTKFSYGVDYLYEPAKKEVLAYIAERSFVAEVYLAYLESFAAEITARMVAMELATNNAQDLISTLTLKLNKARQLAITRELTDIVGGAEAIKGN